MIQDKNTLGAEMIPKEILQLSTPEKLQLVEELWNDIALHPNEIHLSPEQEAELDRRLEFHQNNPGAGVPWEEVKSKLRPSH
jgi:putative addiction module component (TIGR02574 family)